MVHQQINTLVAVGMVLAFGIGASYVIVEFAQNTEFTYLTSTYTADARSTIEVGQ